jgi:uncharacterized phage protein (TIGR02216 family)
MMGIQPSEFWEMSIKEVTLVIEGFREYNTGKKSAPMTRDDLEDLMERYPDN